MLPEVGSGKLLVRVFGGGGSYKLSVGLLDRSVTDWEEFDGMLDSDDDYYPFSLGSEYLGVDRSDEHYDAQARFKDEFYALVQSVYSWPGSAKKNKALRLLMRHKPWVDRGSAVPDGFAADLEEVILWAHEQGEAKTQVNAENLIRPAIELAGPKNEREEIRVRAKVKVMEKTARMKIQLKGGVQKVLWYQRGLEAMEKNSWREAEVWLDLALEAR